MKTIFVAPAKTPYSDNSTWFPVPCGTNLWLKPGQRVVMLEPGEHIVDSRGTVCESADDSKH